MGDLRLKFCKDCRFYQNSLCVAHSKLSEFDLVTGRERFAGRRVPERERASILPWSCGKQGRYFTPRLIHHVTELNHDAY
jgi:hypothetical protein